MLPYRIAEPNEALIITGARAQQGETDYKIVVGHGVWVMPFFRKARTLGLNAHQVQIIEDCVTKQGIPVKVEGVVVFKVAADPTSIANAAQRFLENEQDMDAKAQNIFAAHLRAIIGSMDVESIIRNRQELAQNVREASATEMQTYGFTIDSFGIQKFADPTGYIEQLAKPHQAQVAAQARIAEAEQDQLATEKEQQVAAANAKAVAESRVRQAELTAQAQEAQAKAEQAGPLATAQAQVAVVEQQTQLATLEADRTQRQLEIDVVRPAEAQARADIAAAEGEKKQASLNAEGEAAAITIKAEAEAKATRLRGEAEGDRQKAIGLGEAAAEGAKLKAQADGISARAQALAENQEAVIGQQIAERLPEIVQAATNLFQGVDKVTVLNGAEGMGDFVRQAMSVGLGLVPLIRDALDNGGVSNGKTHAKPTVESDVSATASS